MQTVDLKKRLIKLRSNTDNAKEEYMLQSVRHSSFDIRRSIISQLLGGL